MKKVNLIIGGRIGAWACELRWHEHRKRLSGVGKSLSPMQAKIEAAVAGLTSMKEDVEVDVWTDSPDLLEKHAVIDRLIWLEMRHHVTWKDARQQADIMATVNELSGYAAAQEIVGQGERLSDQDWITETMKAHKLRRKEMGLEKAE